MAGRLESVREVRLEKLEKLKKQGVNPYSPKYSKNRTEISKARESEGKEVNVTGRITGWRGHGSIVFADLTDETGQIQLWFQKDKLGEKFDDLDLFDLGDFIGASGQVVKTKAGEITVEVLDFEILTKAIRPLPSAWHGLKDVEERYRQRYVDMLLNPKVKETFLFRTKFVKLLREYLDNNGFVEVETPILQPIYGGASARPFTTHHNALDFDLFLRISDELYLKRLIVGGFEKVYEMGHDFRNEGLEKGRNPEFTQLEFYWAYADYEDLMKFTEEMLSSIIEKLKGSLVVEVGDKTLEFATPWKRVTYRQLWQEHLAIDINEVKTEKELLDLVKAKDLKVDLKGVAGFGATLDTIYKRLIRPNIVGPIFLTDRPVEMVPLAKRKEDDPTKVATFQLVALGEEFLNAYNELNDPQDQRARWEDETKLGEKGNEEHQVLDEDYIRALEYGMPPTAGWGLGIDRFVMLLTNAANLKEVIIFPTLRPESK